jgi:hypothetical protein
MIGTLTTYFLLAFVITFVFTFILYKIIKPGIKQFKNKWFWITVTLGTPLLCIGIITIWMGQNSSFTKRQFDQSQWENNRHMRYEYVDDLIETKKVIGLTREEVKLILGETDNESDSTMTYYLGYSTKKRFKQIPDWLEIRMEHNKAKSLRID